MLPGVKGSKRAPSRELLLANHSFPGPYVVKAFGPGADSFREEVEACAHAVVGVRVEVTQRASKGGNRMCVTLTLDAKNVDEVIDVYDRVHEVDGLKLIL